MGAGGLSRVRLAARVEAAFVSARTAGERAARLLEHRGRYDPAAACGALAGIVEACDIAAGLILAVPEKARSPYARWVLGRIEEQGRAAEEVLTRALRDVECGCPRALATDE